VALVYYDVYAANKKRTSRKAKERKTMKRIEILDRAIANDTKPEGVGYAFFWAYRSTIYTKNDVLDFGAVIWDRDQTELFSNLDDFGITEITISNSSTGLMETLKAFCESGWKVTGMTEVKSECIDWKTGKLQKIPAIKLAKEC
jgi:hypothetical protein